MKYPDINLGRVEAVWNKLGGEEGVERFLRGELTVSEPTRHWREKDGVIYFRVTSDGTTGPEWITRLKSKGFRIGDYAGQLLMSDNFKPTTLVTSEIAILKGMLFKDGKRITKNIRAEAEKCKLLKPNVEATCLIRYNFTDEEIKVMGLVCIVVMHEPIQGSYDNPNLLHVNSGGSGRWLGAYSDEPGCRWDRENGFAFVVSQVGLQK